MDTISQIALGAAVGVAVMGRRTAVWKAALWGGVCGMLPDLDALIDHGDAVSNMTQHRAESHSLFWLTLASPLLDAITIYGTQLGLPFTDRPYGVGSIFIIDPLYTLPLLAGLAVTLARRGPSRWRANAIGLALSSAYLGWGMLAQGAVESQVRDALAAQGDPAARELPMLVTPTPFNSLLWRVVVLRADRYEEGFVSLLDGGRPPRFDSFDRGSGLHAAVRELPAVQAMTRFTHGFWRIAERDGRITLTDLRMGQEPFYSFSFVVAERSSNPHAQPLSPVNVGGRQGIDIGATLAWLRRRALGADELPPRPALTAPADRIRPRAALSG